MCFSASASFIAGGALTISGLVLLSRGRIDRTTLFASFPLFFGIQQIIEGFVWQTMGDMSSCMNEPNNFVYAYLFFAYIFWPIMTPLSVYLIETVPKRKKIISLTLALGIMTALILLEVLLENGLTSNIMVCVRGHSLAYVMDPMHPYIFFLLYLVSTIGSLLASSNKQINYFGVALLFALLISLIVFFGAHSSVWCFFAAILSVMVFYIVKKLR